MTVFTRDERIENVVSVEAEIAYKGVNGEKLYRLWCCDDPVSYAQNPFKYMRTWCVFVNREDVLDIEI